MNLVKLVPEVAQDARFEAEVNGRSVSIEAGGDIHVRGNRALLRSAVENVVRNAIRYAPANTSVSITMTSTGAPGLASIAIRDHGPGVPAAMLTRLFDPFFRVDDARDRTSGGAGLGLAIARQAMIAHGGNASVQNHPGGGLVVLLELPVMSVFA